MKRPYLVNFLAIRTDDTINIRALVSQKNHATAGLIGSDFIPASPLDNIRMLGSKNYWLKLVFLNKDKEVIKTKVLESDHFGNFQEKLPLQSGLQDAEIIKSYEIGSLDGVEFLLGTHFLIKMEGHFKVVVCDFDKTLVDTRYSSTKDVYHSLTRPVGFFPDVNESIELITKLIDEGHHPFILSASPHFYEQSIRDWLYQHNIYTAGVFLKDYRLMFNPLADGRLTPKDIKTQGLYKLNHLLDILYMTGIPNELVLIGDNYESDPLIYLTLTEFLTGQTEPWRLWSKVQKHPAFQFNSRQTSAILAKLYHIRDKARLKSSSIKIFIRAIKPTTELNIPAFLRQHTNKLIYYPIVRNNEKTEGKEKITTPILK